MVMMLLIKQGKYNRMGEPHLEHKIRHKCRRI